MLFRGDIPRNSKGQYDRGTLLRALKKTFKNSIKSRSGKSKDKFPKNYQLVVISMHTLETEQEVDFLKVLYKYYSNDWHTSMSEIPYETKYTGRNGDFWYWWWVRANETHSPPFSEDVSWQTLADTLDFSPEVIQEKLIDQTWDGYPLRFIELIELLKEYMETRGDDPYVIYLHSRNGINRSGSTEVAYNMMVHQEDIESAWNNSLLTENGETLEYHKPQEAKTFLMYFKAYLDSL